MGIEITETDELNQDYEDLSTNKNDLFGIEGMEEILWKQIEDNSTAIDDELKHSTNELAGFLEKYPDCEDGPTVQMTLKIIDITNRLLKSKSKEREFLLNKTKIKERGFSGYGKEDLNRIILCMSAETEFNFGGKGRGNIGTLKSIEETLRKKGIKHDKNTFREKIRNMIKSGYVQKIQTNLTKLLENKEKILENIEKIEEK